MKKQPTDAVYERMLHVWKAKNYVALAPHLHVSAAAIRQNKSEGIVPEMYILRTQVGTRCREAWLLRGEEPIYLEDLLVSDLAAPLQEAVRLMVGCPSAELHAIFLRVARLLAVAHPDPTRLMITAVEMAEYQYAKAVALRTRVPPCSGG